MPEDRKPDEKRPARGGASGGATARGSSGRTPGKGPGGRSAAPSGGLGGKSGTSGQGSRGGQGGRGRTRPPTQVVNPGRPWGLIAAAVAVVVFAVAAIGYAVVSVNRSNANEVTAASQIEGVAVLDYAPGQEHVGTPVEYTESPPVGGPHDPEWADCTGTVYSADIRHENAVHGMEHGAVWITYDPDAVGDADLATLTDLVEGESGRMLSPYVGLGSPISLQSWNHQLSVDSASDPRVQQYVDFFTFGTDEDGTSLYPEVGASCENPAFVADPLLEGDDSRSATGAVPTDAATTPTAGSEPAAPTTAG